MEAVFSVAGRSGVDTSFDMTGSPDALASIARFTRTRGSVVLIGDTANPARQMLGGDILRRELNLVGVHDSGIIRSREETDVRRWTFAENVGLFFDLVQRNRLNVTSLQTHRYAAQEASQAFASLLDPARRAIGIVLDWTK